MRATTNTVLDNKDPVIRVDHNGIVLDFVISVTVFRRSNFQESEVFGEINRYWSTLSQEKQDEIFSIYQQIHEIFQVCQFDMSRSWSRRELDEALRKPVTRLVNLHPLSHVLDWIKYRSGIQVPPNFESVFVANIDTNTTEEKTYTRSDYLELLAMSLALRVMIPIWSEFINRTLKETGQHFKEFYAFQLIADSELMRSPQMHKLNVYVNGLVVDKKDKLNNILDGVSSEDYTPRMISLVVVRRLCMAKLQGTEKANLVTGVYMYILHKISNPESSGDRVKGNEPGESMDDDKNSVLERIRVKTDLSLGEIVELETAASDIQHVGSTLSVMVNEEEYQNHLQRALDTASLRENSRVSEPQVQLLRWTMARVIPPDGMLYVGEDISYRSLAVLEAALWARGHHYLSVLCTAQTVTLKDKAVNAFSLSKTDSVSPIPQDMIDELRVWYPFVNTNSGRRTGPQVVSDVEASIDQLAKKFSSSIWRATCSEAMLKQALGTTNRTLTIRSDIKILLAKLVIEIGSRKIEKTIA